MPRVIVVGAGLAGLAAAQELRNKGVEVVVVEARDRVGGRVWTSHFKEGTATDLGASFIHGVTHNPIADFADLLNQELLARGSCTLFDEDGTKVIPRVDKRVEQLFNEVLTKACERRKDYVTLPDENAEDQSGEPKSTSPANKTAKRPRIHTGSPSRQRSSSAGSNDSCGVSVCESTRSGHTSPDSSTGSNNGGKGQASAASSAAKQADSGTTSISGTPETTVGATDGPAVTVVHTPPTIICNSTSTKMENCRDIHADATSANTQFNNGTNGESTMSNASPSHQTHMDIEAKLKRASGCSDESLEDAIQAEIPQPLEGVELRAFNWHMANLEYSVCSDLKDVSNRDWDQDDVYGFGGAHCVVKGGMGHIARNLARGLDIRFNSPVKCVRYLSDKVSVEIGTGQHLDADACLITLPLGVLKAGSVSFSPPLPVPKTKAIERLGFGILNKVVLLFPRVFWDASDFIGYTHSQRGTFPMFVDVSEAVGRPMLIALISGSPAIDMERYTEAGACKLAMDALHKIFKARTLRPLQCILTRWHSDPYALGSYSYVQVDGSADDYDAMAAPVASRAGAKRGATFRLFFAGEATNRYYPATVHGAFLSGIREAKRIMKSLRVQTQVKRQVLTSGGGGSGGIGRATTPVMKMDRSMGNKGRMAVKSAHRTNVDNLSRAHIKAHILHQHSFGFPPKGDYADRIRRPPGNNPRVPLPLAMPNIPGAEDSQGQVWPKTLSDRLHGCIECELPNVGDYVLVNWSEDQKYYGGHVTKLDKPSGRAGVLYDDGEYEELNLSKEGFKFPARTGPHPLKWKPSAITDADLVGAPTSDVGGEEDPSQTSGNGKKADGGSKRAKTTKTRSKPATAASTTSTPRLKHLRSRKRVVLRRLTIPLSPKLTPSQLTSLGDERPQGKEGVSSSASKILRN